MLASRDRQEVKAGEVSGFYSDHADPAKPTRSCLKWVIQRENQRVLIKDVCSSRSEIQGNRCGRAAETAVAVKIVAGVPPCSSTNIFSIRQLKCPMKWKLSDNPLRDGVAELHNKLPKTPELSCK